MKQERPQWLLDACKKADVDPERIFPYGGGIEHMSKCFFEISSAACLIGILNARLEGAKDDIRALLDHLEAIPDLGTFPYDGMSQDVFMRRIKSQLRTEWRTKEERVMEKLAGE